LGAGIRVSKFNDDLNRFEADLLDEKGEQVARVSKEIYVRNRTMKRSDK